MNERSRDAVSPCEEGLSFKEALARMKTGTRMTRRTWRDEFAIQSGDRLVRGRFIGETGLARVHVWIPGSEDREAWDWRPFLRILPDAWEGCDAPRT